MCGGWNPGTDSFRDQLIDRKDEGNKIVLGAGATEAATQPSQSKKLVKTSANNH